jgi:hypothetical protein
MTILPRISDTRQYLLGVLIALPVSLAGTAMIFLIASGGMAI